MEDRPVAPSTEAAPNVAAHTYVCPECGQTIDPGNLAQALYHGRASHKYDQRSRPRAGVAVASLARAWNVTDSNSRR
jgi:hypothetical protein